ncbi:hypothetical protein ABFP60_02480 [Clostridioides difficile]
MIYEKIRISDICNNLKENIPFELHIYPNGVHGLGLCEESTAMNGKSEHIDSPVAT